MTEKPNVSHTVPKNKWQQRIASERISLTNPPIRNSNSRLPYVPTELMPSTRPGANVASALPSRTPFGMSYPANAAKDAK